MCREEFRDENELQTCQLLNCLFRSADKLWNEPFFQTNKKITGKKNSVKLRVKLPIDWHCAKFKFDWDCTELKQLKVTLTFTTEDGKKRNLKSTDNTVLSHEEGSTSEQWHINLHRRERWEILLTGNGLLADEASVNICIIGGTWDWNRSSEATEKFYSAWNKLFGYKKEQEADEYVYIGKYAGLIWSIINYYLWDMSDEDKEDCYQEIQDKLQGCNCRRLRMWNRKMARFSTYLGTIAKRTCIDFVRKKKRERGEPVKEDENLELLEDFAMEEDEIEKLAAPDRHPLADMVDREFMEEIEQRLREFLEERLTK